MAVPPLSSFKAAHSGTVTTHRTAWRANAATFPAKDPASVRLPQKILHDEAEETYPDLGQRTASQARR